MKYIQPVYQVLLDCHLTVFPVVWHTEIRIAVGLGLLEEKELLFTFPLKNIIILFIAKVSLLIRSCSSALRIIVSLYNDIGLLGEKR